MEYWGDIGMRILSNNPQRPSNSLTKRIQKVQQMQRAWETDIGDLEKVGKAA